jgi:exosortase
MTCMSSQGERTDIVAVILAGGAEFGACSFRGALPAALWPVAGRPAVERVIEQLALNGVRRVVIAVRGEIADHFARLNTPADVEVTVSPETLPLGTAGAVRDAVKQEKDGTVIVLQANTAGLADMSPVLASHEKTNADMTVVLHPDGQAAGIYLIKSSLLSLMPADGYFDIKESFVPLLLRDRRRISCTKLREACRAFNDYRQYLAAMADYVASKVHSETDYVSRADGVLVHRTATIASDARIIGPAMIMGGVRIESGATICGPAVIEPDVEIGKNAVVSQSVVWAGARIGDNCSLLNCLVTSGSIVVRRQCRQFSIVDTVSQSPIRLLWAGACSCIAGATDRVKGLAGSASLKAGSMIDKLRPGTATVAAGAILFIAFVWLYRFDIAELWGVWQRSDEYSSGLLVPPMIAYILYVRRESLSAIPLRPFIPAVFIFLGAQVLRAAGILLMYASIERYSMMISAAALVLLLLGVRFVKAIWPVLLFSLLMLPLPQSVHTYVTIPLQNWATSSAVFCLELVNMDVLREGNILHIGSATVAVAEACNGLRMITAFFVVTGVVVLIVNRSWHEKLILLVSTIPIALACNAVRLTVTAIAFTLIDGPRWGKAFHDFGGLAMMPLALGMVMFELWILSKVFVVAAARPEYRDGGRYAVGHSSASEAGNG